MISIIAAIAANGVIGKNNSLPRPHLPWDMKHFRSCITDQIIVMGSKTAQSFRDHPKLQTSMIAQQWWHPAAKHSIIMSQTKKNLTYQCPKTQKIVSRTDQSPHQLIINYPYDDLWIIWWASIYNLRLPFADRLVITHIDKVYDGDIVFPHRESYWFAIEKEQSWYDEGTRLCIYKKTNT